MSASAIGSVSARSGSYAGSGTSSRSSASRRISGGPDRENLDGAGEDIFDRSSSLEIGIFGVLCTLRKENNEARVRIRWVLIKILLDALQLFTTVISPATQGWSINAKGPAWLVVSVLTFGWISKLNYGAYLALLYITVGLLGVHIGLCVWALWCFKEQKFPVVWPLKALRLSSSVFFQAFDVAILNILELGITCRYTGNEETKMSFNLFPEYSCSKSPHAAHAVVSGLSLGLFVAIALLTNLAEVEVNLLSRRPFALGHSGPVITAFAIKVLITLVRVFIGWRRVAAGLYLGLSLAFAWQFVRWAPHLVNWVNYLRAGVAAMLVWCSAMLTLLVFQPGIKGRDMKKWEGALTLTMLLGLGPAFGVGALLTWAMIQHMTSATLRDLKNAKPGVPLADICLSMFDPQDVEIVARCCRVWKDRYTVDPAAVEKARHVIQAGMAMFPNSAYMVLLQANFMIDVLGVSQSGSRRIEDARKLNPGIMSRFIMFVRQQQASQQAASNHAKGGGSSMDLLAYVEYQRKQRMVVRLHREALQAMCNFWRALDSSRVSFTHLSKALGKVESSVSQAQTAYRVVLESYGSNPKLVRLYGKFLQTIKNDPWRATEYFTEADRLEELQSGDAGGPLLPDGTPLGRMDEIATAVLVISSNGEVQMANRHAHHLFGYKRGTLEGKPMGTLLAPHYNRWLSEHLSYIVDRSELLAAVGGGRDPEDGGGGGSGGGGGGDFNETNVVVGMHSERVAFPVKLSICKASGVGEDSTFIAMMEVLPAAKGVASLWVAQNGTIVSCDPQFVMSYGWKPHEVNGAALTAVLAIQEALAAESILGGATGSNNDAEVGNGAGPLVACSSSAGPTEAMNRLLQAARAGTRGAPTEGLRCLVAHKYDGEPVSCNSYIVNTGLMDATVYEVKLKQDIQSLSRQMLVVNRKGSILHASPDLLSSLVGAAEGGGASGTMERAGGHSSGFLRGLQTPMPVGSGAAAAGSGAAGIGAGAAAALGLAGLMGMDQVAGFTLCDFLPTPWKEMHFKYLRATTAITPPSRTLLTCRKEDSLGPTLELQTMAGKPLFVRVSVITTDVAGEINHVIRMSKSSKEIALGERRLRLQTTHEGIICGVNGGPAAQLLGLAGCELTGRPLWELSDWSSQVDCGGLAAGPHLFTALVKRELADPGCSWRVQVFPPAFVRESGNPGNTTSELVRTALASMTKPAVMQVHVEMPTSMGSGAADEPKFFVDLWFQSSVTGLLEVDPIGRIRSVLEEHLRPAGLMFGLATHSLMGCMLDELVTLPPGRQRPMDLLFSHGAKKSSLKASAADMSFKVGPMHVLQATHRDGRPNAIEVQIVGSCKPGSNQNAYVILRSHTPPLMPSALFPPPRGPAPTAIATMVAAPSVGPRAMVAGAPAGSVAAPAGGMSLYLSTGGVVGVSTPPAAVTRNDRGRSLEEEDFAVALMFGCDARPPPLPDGLGGLGGGLPVPAVAPAAAAKATGTLSSATSRIKLGDMVRSVEGHRSGTVSRKATSGSGGSGRLLAAERDGALARQAAAAAGVSLEGGNTLKDGALEEAAAMPLDIESMDGDDIEPGRTSGPGGGKERISNWVASKGAFYQNSVMVDKLKADDDDDDDATKPVHDRPLPGDGLGRADLKALLRHGGAGAGEDDDDAVAGNKTSIAAVDMAAVGRGVPVVDWAARRVSDATAVIPPDDDAASEGGMSAMSGQSGDGGADYKRGKRFRKLMKLMNSGQAHMVQRRYRLHALATVALLAVVHIVCFALTIHSIRTKRDSMLQLGRSGQAQRYMHQILTDVRSLDIISRKKVPPMHNLYRNNDTQFFIGRISIAAEAIQTRFKEILDSHSSSQTSRVRSLLFFTTRSVWDGKEYDGTDKYANITIWDFATRFCAMAKDVEQHGASWVQQQVAIADNTTAGQFLIKSGPDLWRASRQVLDALLYAAVDDARWVDNLQIVFLCVEGAVVTSIAALYLAFLLRTVAAQRYKLYSVFMLIPLGLTRALASQNTNLAVDEEDEDDADDLDDRQTLGGDDPLEGDSPSVAAAKPKRRATLAVGSAESPSYDGGGSVVRDAMVSSPKAADSRNRFLRARSGRSRATEASSLDAGVRPNSGGGGVLGAFSRTALRLRQVLTRRVSRVAPLPSPSAAAIDTTLVSKRRLKYDSHETVWLLLPFIVWSALVVAIYTIVVMQMRGIVGVLAVHSVVNFIAARTYRAVFFSQELAAVEDPSLIAPRRAAVITVLKVVRDAWYTLQLGSDAYKATGPNTERFPLVKSGGLAYASPLLAHIFYGSNQCHRLPATGPCPGPEDRFHLVIHAGLDSIMQMFMMHVDALGSWKSPVPPGLDNDHLDFIYNVGTKDLMDGTVEIQEAHLATIMNLFENLFVLHIILLVMFWVIFSFFLLFLLNPLLTRIARERRRVAELMSQLPLELDVERLVARALGASSGSGTPASSGQGFGGLGPGAGHFSGGEALSNGTAIDTETDAVTKWKNIIRSASSQLVKTQSGGSNNGRGPL